MTCPRESQHAEFAHVDLGEGEWAHFTRKLNNEQKQQIEVARLAADYETKNTADAVYWAIHMRLGTAPADWRLGYTDADGSVREPQFEPTMREVRYWLNEYETKMETVLLGPETRQKMAKATVDYYAACASVFCVGGSWGDGVPTDATLSEMVEQKALEHYYEWRAGVNARLKAVGVASSAESTTP